MWLQADAVAADPEKGDVMADRQMEHQSSIKFDIPEKQPPTDDEEAGSRLRVSPKPEDMQQLNQFTFSASHPQMHSKK